MAADTVKFVASVLGVQASADDLAAPAIHVGSTCRALASSSSNPQAYLGDAAGPSAEILQWLMWAGQEISTLTDEKLMKVNATLASRTFLAGSTLTLADLVVFGVVYPATTSFPVAQYNHFCNLLRWADHVQSLAGEDKVAASFPKGPLRVIKPIFLAPPPPAPPAPPAAAAPAKGAAAAAAAPAAADKKGAAPAAATAAAAAPAAAARSAPSTAKSAPSKADAAGAPKDAAAPKEKKEKKEKEPKEKKEGGGGGAKEEEEARIDMLDIRVGQIVKVGKHPNADALYLEEIDVGEDQPRQVISGLVKFVPLEEMQNRRVLVVLNLKPAKMRDVMSYGMVLCASTEEHDKVVPVAAPEGVPLGERVMVQGYDQAPLDEVNPKKKILERLFPDMKTNAEGVPCYKGVPFTSSKGPLTSPLPNAWVK